MDQPGHGPVRAVAPPWKFAASPATISCGAPRLGEHTSALLAEIGVGPQHMARLHAAGMIVMPAAVHAT